MKAEIIKLIEENEEIVEKNLYRWITNFKRKKPDFSIPTDEEIRNYFIECGYLMPPGIIGKIRNCYEGKIEGKWVDSRGQEVRSWKNKVRAVWMKDCKKVNNNDRYEIF